MKIDTSQSTGGSGSGVAGSRFGLLIIRRFTAGCLFTGIFDPQYSVSISQIIFPHSFIFITIRPNLNTEAVTLITDPTPFIHV